MTDRLEEIKRKRDFGGEDGGDVDWLIAEVERLRKTQLPSLDSIGAPCVGCGKMTQNTDGPFGPPMCLVCLVAQRKEAEAKAKIPKDLLRSGR